MAISGTVPYFGHNLVNPTEGTTVVTVTGLSADGQATGTYSNEGLREFFIRGIGVFGGVSGMETVSGVAAELDGVAITSGQLSGMMQYQRELSMRIADITHPDGSNVPRLAKAVAVLAVSGGEIKGLG